MVERTKLREAQLYELELLKKIKNICESEGIKYFLLGGTALGAVRHKGFIPWDDDIDVGLMRADYEKFIITAPKYLDPGEEILHYSIDRKYHDYSAKLVNTKVSFATKRDNDIVRQNIWVDIFPIDGSPKNTLIRRIHYCWAYFVRMLLALNHINSIHYKENRSAVRIIIIKFARVVPVGKLIDPNKVKRYLDKILQRYSTDQSVIVANYIGAYHEREFIPREYFGNGVEMLFENEYFTLPAKTDEYLTHIYGDYMKLPSKDKQVPTHHVIDAVQDPMVKAEVAKKLRKLKNRH